MVLILFKSLQHVLTIKKKESHEFEIEQEKLYWRVWKEEREERSYAIVLLLQK